LPTLDSEGALNRPGMLPSTQGAPSGGLPDVSAISANSYLYAVQSETLRKQANVGTQKISSLAPTREGTLRQLMLEGEQNFRQGRYGQAARDFRRATAIYPNSPEVMLSLFHTHLAGSSGSRFYELSAHCLGQTLRRLPELPLIPVHPKKFYQDASLYIRDRQAVERRTRDASNDGDAWLILGYLAWRDGNIRSARRALRHAITYGSAATIESASILWDGILATGKAKGQLVPMKKEQPTPAKKPSADSDPSTQSPSPDPS
jgi:tetratricopeptide (TPR) repeat protein